MKWSQAKIEEIESSLTWWTIEKVSDTNYWTSKSLEWNLKMVLSTSRISFSTFQWITSRIHVQGWPSKNLPQDVTGKAGFQEGWGCDPKLAYKSHMGLLTKLVLIWFIWWRHWEEMDSRLKAFNFRGWFTFFWINARKFNKKWWFLAGKIFVGQFLYNQWVQLISFQKRHDTRDGFREAIKPIRVKNFGQWPDL